MDWFTVDRKGLAQLLARKGMEFVLLELIQNAWDEDTSEVRVSLTRIAGTRNVRLIVEDDNPEGFADLSHAWTLFAESSKKSSALKRGRFNLGEKLVLSLCLEASIASTKGTIVFDASGRHAKRAKRERGSVFSGVMRMTNDEIERCDAAVRSLLPPAGIKTFYNGAALAARTSTAELSATLQTEIADAEGHLRKVQRKTCVEIHEPLPGEVPMLFELGIPVVETGDRWHLNVMQKVPLSFDRDNVPPAYLSRVRALAVDTMRARLTAEDANAAWVREAMQRHGEDMAPETVLRLTELRFGEKRVAYDPSDAEANQRAMAQGYTVVYGSQMAKSEWAAVRRVGALLPAGQVTPSPKPYAEGGRELRRVDEADWTPEMHAVVRYVQRIAPPLVGAAVSVTIVREPQWPFGATYGSGHLTLNLGRLGHKWFSGPLTAINGLLLHEFGHHYEMNHLSAAYHDALTDLGARLTEIALREPNLFELGVA